MDDPFALQRFVDAQQGTYAQALAELHAGAKTSHWMWFVFPQIAGLGQSATARRYAIRSLAEARAYLAHPVLGPRLAEAVAAIAHAPGRSARDMLGEVDAVKLRSSLTLFLAAGATGEFAHALDRFYAGRPDPATERLIG